LSADPFRRKAQHDPRATALGVLGNDGATVRLRDLAHDRKP
jgi:hypothetical protein